MEISHEPAVSVDGNMATITVHHGQSTAHHIGAMWIKDETGSVAFQFMPVPSSGPAPVVAVLEVSKGEAWNHASLQVVLVVPCKIPQAFPCCAFVQCPHVNHPRRYRPAARSCGRIRGVTFTASGSGLLRLEARPMPLGRTDSRFPQAPFVSRSVTSRRICTSHALRIFECRLFNPGHTSPELTVQPNRDCALRIKDDPQTLALARRHTACITCHGMPYLSYVTPLCGLKTSRAYRS